MFGGLAGESKARHAISFLMKLFLLTLRHAVSLAGRGRAGLWLGLLAALWLGGCAAPTGPRATYNTVVVDAGHGGHDSGALSRRGRGPRLKEKDLALDVSQRVAAKLRAAGVRVVMTRNSDVFIPLDTRVAYSNRQRNSLFLSIHFNYSPKRHIHGSEIYHNDRGTYLVTKRLKQRLNTVPGLRNRFIKTAQFRVLRNSRGPAVLVECSYLTHASEAVRSASPAYREEIATAIAAAVLESRR